MQIRRAEVRDIPRIHELLSQVLEVHANGRPDLFIHGTRKYTDEEIAQILADETMPVYVAVDDDDVAIGHCFCELQDKSGSNNMQPVRTYYIHDLCVDENVRGQHVGTALYQHVVALAREGGFHNVCLNVWSCNANAMAFYEAMGMHPYRVGMEQLL